jgi:cytochrome c biogenesis protein CcmG/thiol:disulfide interchange protein DsbE
MIYKIFIPLLFFSVITGSSKNTYNKNQPSSAGNLVFATEKNKAPGFSLTGTDGKIKKLSDFKGKIVIIDFWATWCAPCRKGIPDLIELQKEFGKKIVIIGISLDQQKSDVIPFMKKMGINYPIVYGSPEVTRQYGGVEAIPATFIIDRKGNIVDQHIGLTPKSEYSDQIKKLLKKT